MTILVKSLLILIACMVTHDYVKSREIRHDVKEYDFLGRFRNNENYIIIQKDRIDINSKRFELVNCSNNEYYCYISQKLGFFVQFTKSCRKSWSYEWLQDKNREMEILSVIPHTSSAIYEFKKNRKFLYLYSYIHGLQAIYYNSGGVLFDDYGDIDFDYMKKFEYRKVSSGKLFPCLL